MTGAGLLYLDKIHPMIHNIPLNKKPDDNLVETFTNSRHTGHRENEMADQLA